MNEDSKYEGKDDEEVRYKKNSWEEQFLIETMFESI